MPSQMRECQHCFHPATGQGLCPYHGGSSIREVLRLRRITRSQFAELGGWSDRTIDNIHAGRKQLSELELRGLLTVDNQQEQPKENEEVAT